MVVQRNQDAISPSMRAEPEKGQGRHKRNLLQKKQKPVKVHKKDKWKRPAETDAQQVQQEPSKVRPSRVARFCAAAKRILGLRSPTDIVVYMTKDITEQKETIDQSAQEALVPVPAPLPVVESVIEGAGETGLQPSTLQTLGVPLQHILVPSDTSSENSSNIGSLPSQDSSNTSIETNDTPPATSEMQSTNRIRKVLSGFKLLKLESVTSALTKNTKGAEIDTNITQPGALEDVDQYDNDGEPTDGEHDRRNLKSIRSIPRLVLQHFVLSYLFPEEEDRRLRTCCVTKRTEGSYNHCIFLVIKSSDHPDQEFVLKIPAHGTKDKWQEGDAFTFRNEAVLVQHIRYHTKCPVPEIVNFDAGLDNAIGAPYVLMKKMQGTCALDFWLGGKFEEMSPDACRAVADSPPIDLDLARAHLLRSLARAMAELQKLRFSKIGTPVLDKPEDEQPSSYGPWWRWHTKLDMFALQPHRPLVSTAAFFGTGTDLASGLLQAYTDPNPNSKDAIRFVGAQTILNMLNEIAPFNRRVMLPLSQQDVDTQPEKDTFVLRHDDLDLHNILVDDEGNVTGILDWDGIISVPQCVGFASIPDFLRRDYFPGDRDRAPYATWSLPNYRDVYVEAMQNACSTSDRFFSKKSMLYQAIYTMLWDHEDIYGVLDIVLKEIEEFRRVDVAHLCYRLGKGAPETEKLLQQKITELFEPELLTC